MTKVEVTYRFTKPFDDTWAASLEALHGVYGLNSLKLSPACDTLTVGYDATRLRRDDVIRQLHQAGLPVEAV